MLVYEYILSESQAAIEAPDNCQINSKLVLDFHQFLEKLAEQKRVQLIWEPRHEGIGGDEIADRLARLGSVYSFIGREPA
jgi:ribonuclease HI